MPAAKRLSLLLCLFLMAPPLALTGCQTTGSPHAAQTDTRLHGETHQFDPDPQGNTSARDLRPVSNRDVIELLREADAAFQRASAAEAAGNSDAASAEFRKMLSLLKEADLDPAQFYASRKEFADDLEREAKARQHRHRGHAKTSPVKIPVPLPAAVIAQIDRIRNDYPNSYQSALDRGQRYIPEIRAKFRQAGLPEELVYIAMIESHFHEKIDSRAGAGGMWQFMPETGRIHGLRQDGFIDARYDWQTATDAAISYFKKLEAHFNGNWPLAIASYNAGEYGIARAVTAAGGEQDFFRLIETEPASNMIKLETKNYYPKFLAYWIIAENAERYGFSINKPAIEPTVEAGVRGSYALDDLDRALGLPGGTLSKLNPELVRQVTPPIGENRITIPATVNDRFQVALASIPQYDQAVRAHTVRKGETLAGIAGKYGITTDELKQANNLKSTKLKSGQKLKLPYAVAMNTAKGGGTSEPDPFVQTAKEQKAQREQAPNVSTYTVKKGDTLGKIAQAQGVSLDDLLADNKLSRKSQIKAGQKLKITKAGAPAPVETASAAPKAPAAAKEHTVAQGETLSAIARTYGVTVAQLEQANGLEKGETIRVGQKLTVNGASGGTSKPAAAPAPAETTVTVAKGDTPAKIAAENGVALKDLLAWNNLTEKSVIQIGQKLTLRGGKAAVAAASEAEGDAKPIQLAKAAPSTVHTVAAGQTPSSIAKRYGVNVNDLFKWNNWGKGHVIRPGDKVVVEQK